MRLVSAAKLKRCLPIAGLILSVIFLFRLHSVYSFFRESPDIAHTKSQNPKRAQEICSRRLPSVLMIGVPSSGSTALAKFLEQHPQISFCQAHTAFFTDNYSKGLSWYRNQMPCSSPGQVVMEQSAYFQDSRVPPRIWHTDQNVKLVVIVRNPIDRANVAYSLRSTNRSLPFEKAVIHHTSKNTLANNTDIRASLFANQMKPWLDQFSRGNMHVVDGDRFLKNPYSEISSLESFLNIDPFFQQEQFVFNNTLGHFCLRIKTSSMCVGTGKDRRIKPISPAAREHLHRFFKPYNEKFAKMASIGFEWV